MKTWVGSKLHLSQFMIHPNSVRSWITMSEFDFVWSGDSPLLIQSSR